MIKILRDREVREQIRQIAHEIQNERPGTSHRQAVGQAAKRLESQVGKESTEARRGEVTHDPRVR